MKKLFLATVFGLSLLATPVFAANELKCSAPPECMNLTTGDNSPSTIHNVPIKVSENNMNSVSGTIDGKIIVDFAIDSGAVIVLIPEDVFRTLMRMGDIKETDMRAKINLMMANGATTSSQNFIISSLKIGDYVAKDVLASVGPSEAPLLLGESFLSRFKSWTIDNEKKILILHE